MIFKAMRLVGQNHELMMHPMDVERLVHALLMTPEFTSQPSLFNRCIASALAGLTDREQAIAVSWLQHQIQRSHALQAYPTIRANILASVGGESHVAQYNRDDVVQLLKNEAHIPRDLRSQWHDKMMCYLRLIDGEAIAHVVARVNEVKMAPFLNHFVEELVQKCVCDINAIVLIQKGFESIQIKHAGKLVFQRMSSLGMLKLFGIGSKYLIASMPMLKKVGLRPFTQRWG